jgi:Na+-translocating ferredoxin:NAD+ oxidoreductase RNF subunit RnfB
MNYALPILFFTGIGVTVGIVLTVAGRLFRVAVDDTVERLTEQLPGINCGACGFASCERYAAAIAAGSAANQCKPGGAETAEKIGAVLGKDVAAAEAETAFVHCMGNCTRKYKYRGTATCRASELYYNGKEGCRFGCAGLGDCVEVCSQGAIVIGKNRRAAVAHFHRCNACGLCVKACPKNLISVQKFRQNVHVACYSKNTGKLTKSVCANGCIGCRICEKKCPQHAIIVKENLATINYDLCNSCGECASHCPTKCIFERTECENSNAN